jgi:hypothetical protein
MLLAHAQTNAVDAHIFRVLGETLRKGKNGQIGF